MTELSDQVVLITGGSTGIGKATALALARDGAKVAIAARNPGKLERAVAEITATGGTAVSIPADVTNAADVESLFGKVLERWDRLDVLINSAGSGVFSPIVDSDPVLWQQTLDVNLTATYLCTRQALASMLEARRGQIVNVLSIAAKVTFKNSSAYCAAKAGALAFTRVLAEEVRDQGIRVTALCPGSVATPFWDAVDPKPDMAQMQKPEDVANVIRWVLTQPEGIVLDEIITTPPLGIL